MINKDEKLPNKIEHINFKQSIKGRLINRYGKKLGSKLVKCFKKCLAKGGGKPVDTEELKQCIIECLGEYYKSNPGEITEENLNQILILCGYWATVG
ncbi:MAG: hypothetical protein ACFFCY_12180 [Promethearchaeota archaeon]